MASVDRFGCQEQALRIVLDPMRIASYNLTIDDVASVLQGVSIDIPAGSFKSEDHMLLVRADASVWRPADIEALVIRGGTRLRDVAQAFYGPADALSHSSVSYIRLTLPATSYG